MRITDIKAVLIDLGPSPLSDAGLRNIRWSVGYVEVFTDEGLTGFCPAASSRAGATPRWTRSWPSARWTSPSGISSGRS